MFQVLKTQIQICEKKITSIYVSMKKRGKEEDVYLCFVFGPFGNWLAVQKKEKEHVLVPKFKNMDEKI